MESVEVAFSVPKPLFERAGDLTWRVKVSCSRLFALALEEYLRRQENRDPLAQINAAYADEPDPTEQTLHRRIVESELVTERREPE